MLSCKQDICLNLFLLQDSGNIQEEKKKKNMSCELLFSVCLFVLSSNVSYKLKDLRFTDVPNLWHANIDTVIYKVYA